MTESEARELRQRMLLAYNSSVASSFGMEAGGFMASLLKDALRCGGHVNSDCAVRRFTRGWTYLTKRGMPLGKHRAWPSSKSLRCYGRI